MKKIIFSLLVGLLLIGNVVLGFWLVHSVQAAQQIAMTQEENAKILAFTKSFIEEVLMANSEVDFNTRLSLETAVRNLNDQDILNQWQRFTKAQNSQEASIERRQAN